MSAINSPINSKKRGRKPKGGKIINIEKSKLSDTPQVSNIILKLRCNLDDITNEVEYNEYCADDLRSTYCNIDTDNDHCAYRDDSYEEESQTIVSTTTAKNATDLLYSKIKMLQKDLHFNVHNNNHPACFWCTYTYTTQMIHLTNTIINDVHHVYGSFCSPECAVAYLMAEPLDSAVKYERLALFYSLYAGVFDNIEKTKPAPDPHYTLDKFQGTLSIQEYRALLQMDRLFVVINKPLIYNMPELHELNGGRSPP